MTRRIASIAAVAIAVLVFANVAFADETFTAQIPFRFVIAGQLHQPGRYEVKVLGNQFNLVLAPDKGPANALMPLARIAPTASVRDDESKLIFDKVGETYFLSEAWFEGQDGFLLQPSLQDVSNRTIVTTGAPR
jgi:hypothetical protein